MENATFTKNFSVRLAARRARQGLVQDDLAKKAGVSLRSVQNWESGESLPTGKKLRQLCAALEVDLGYFFEPGEGDSSKEEGMQYEGGTVTEKCKLHLSRFLRTCGEDPNKLGWTLIELRARFPLDKWASETAQSQITHDALFEEKHGVPKDIYRVAVDSMEDAERLAMEESEQPKKEGSGKQRRR